MAQELGHAQLAINSEATAAGTLVFRRFALDIWSARSGVDTQNFAIGRVPDELAKAEPKERRDVLSKTRTAMKRDLLQSIR